MMIRSLSDLHPLLRRQYARNKERLESGTAPPIADMFADTDIVFAVWPDSDAGIFNYCTIKGRGLMQEAFDSSALISGKVDTLPVSDRDGASGARRTDAGRTVAARSAHHADRMGRAHRGGYRRERKFMIKVVGQATRRVWRPAGRRDREEDRGGGRQAPRRCEPRARERRRGSRAAAEPAAQVERTSVPLNDLKLLPLSAE
jgi:hypothetical protein